MCVPQAVPGSHRRSQLYRHLQRWHQAVDRRPGQHRPLLGSEGGSAAAAARLHLTGSPRSAATGTLAASKGKFSRYSSSFPVCRSSLWATVPRESGSQLGWRAATWRSSMSPSRTNTSFTYTRAVSCPFALPIAVSKWWHCCAFRRVDAF